MEKNYRRVYRYIAFAAGLYALVTHFELVIAGINYISDLIMPVIVGFLIAFILNVPVTGFENLFGRIFRKRKHRPNEKAIHFTSILLSFICIILVVVLFCVMVIPELVKTIKSIAELIKESWPTWLAQLENYNINTNGIKAWLNDFDWQSVIGKVSGYAGDVIGSVAGAASSTISVVSLTVVGIIIAFYTLVDRNKLAGQAKNILYAYTKSAFSDKLLHVCRLIKEAYTKFLTGQCVEAIILGVLITIAFSVFRLPYAALIGTVTAICALVPYIGAFISCALGVILALMVSPQKALMCLVVYLAVQLIDAQFIYPHVVGGSVGLSPLWTIIAVLIGGKLFGLVGMIFFIPLVSVLYVLIKEDAAKRLQNKEGKTAYADSDYGL